jgi:hypothetical protein
VAIYQQQKANELLDKARKSLYGLLADDDQTS